MHNIPSIKAVNNLFAIARWRPTRRALADDDLDVSTQQIADLAGANACMILDTLCSESEPAAYGAVQSLKQVGHVADSVDPDVLRLSFVGLAMTPLLVMDVFEEETDVPMDIELPDAPDRNGELLAAGLAAAASAEPSP